MNQRLTRKEMKRNEFVEALERSAGFLERNARWLVIGAAVVLVLVLAGFGAWMWLERQETRANAALADALEVYRAPVGPDAAAQADADAPHFADAAARRQRAREMFTALRDDFRFADSADVADVYLGEIAADEGQPDRARELWQSFVDAHPDHVLADQVRVNLLHLDRDQGQGEQVASRLEAMLAGPAEDRELPGDVILYELAQTYEGLGKTDQEQASYQRLVEEYPTSPYTSVARQHAGPAAAGAAAPVTLR